MNAHPTQDRPDIDRAQRMREPRGPPDDAREEPDLEAIAAHGEMQIARERLSATVREQQGNRHEGVEVALMGDDIEGTRRAGIILETMDFDGDGKVGNRGKQACQRESAERRYLLLHTHASGKWTSNEDTCERIVSFLA